MKIGPNQSYGAFGIGPDHPYLSRWRDLPSAPNLADRASAAYEWAGIQRRPNISFHRPYDNDDLPTILGQFRTGLLPYRVDYPMTEHVNPDKLHHYLSAGLEVVASPIPAARRLKRYLHLMTTDGNWATLLSDLPTGRQNNWPRETYTWDRRWAELVNFVLPDEAIVNGVRPAAQP